MQTALNAVNLILQLASCLTGGDQSLKIGFLATTGTLTLIAVGKLLETALGLVLIAFGYALRYAVLGG